MATVNLTDYDAQTAAIQQRQKLAELLQQQSMQPIDVQSYQGIQAPISPLSGLAKILQSYQAAKMQKDATTDASALRANERDDYAKQVVAALGGAQTPAAAPQAPAGPSVSDIAAMPPVQVQTPSMPQANPIASALAQQAPAQMPQGDISDIAGRMQAPMGPPAQMPQGDISDIAGRMGAPFAPQQSTNPLAQALSNSGQPPGPASAPPMQAQAPPMLRAPSPGMGGPMPPVMKPQVDLSPPSNPALTPQSPADKAKAQYLAAINMYSSPNPYVRAAAPEILKQAQEQIKKISDLADAQTQKDAAHAEDVAHATAYVNALTNVSDDVRAGLLAGANTNGMAGVKSFMDKSQEFAATPQARMATPDEVASFGLPKGSSGQYDEHGIFKVTFDPTDHINENARTKIAAHNSAREDMVAAQNAAGPGDLSENAKDIAALTYLKNGTLPSGMGKQAVEMRRDIMNRAAELAAQKGTTPDQVVANRAQYRADSQSLNGLTKTTDMITAFENTAAAHFDNALKLAPKGVPTNMGPWINRWVQTGDTGTGNTAVPAYVAQLLTGANEYAKVIEGATGAAGSSVSSRQEAAALFNKAYNYDQIKGVIDVAKSSMEAKKNQYNAQKSEIQKRLGGGGQAPPTAAPPATAPSSGGWGVPRVVQH